MTTTPVILTVCLGNICRSPLAEWMLRARLGDIVHVESAGIIARDGESMEPKAAEEVRRRGGDPSALRATRATTQLVKDADLVLAMTKDIRAEVLRLHPGALKRAFTLGEFATVAPHAPAVSSLPDLVREVARRRSDGADAADVDDPMGGSLADHHAAAEAIAAYVDLMAPPLLAALHASFA